MTEPETPHTDAVATDAVVVGGGVAGLVAAVEVARAGHSVLLLERTTRLGGRVNTAMLAGLPVDLGAESFATRDGTVAALLDELEMIATEPAGLPAWVVNPRDAYPLPPAGALGVPTDPLSRPALRALGPLTALRVAAEPYLLRRPTAHGPSPSIGEVARSRIGSRATRRLVAPVVTGVYSAAPDRLPLAVCPELARAYAETGSLVRAARVARASQAASGGAVRGLPGGMGTLVARLEDELRAHGGNIVTTARDIRLDPLTNRVRWAGGEMIAAATILAIPAHEVASITAVGVSALAPDQGNATPEDAVALNRETHTTSRASAIAVETVALVIEDARLEAAPRGTGALVSQPHPRIAAKALTHASAKWPWLRPSAAPGVPAALHVLRLSYGSRDRAPATQPLTDEEAARLALQDASRVLGVLLDPAQLRAHARARWAIPGRAQPPRLPRGVRVTGEAFAGTGLASVIAHARETARLVITDLHASHPPVEKGIS